MERKTSWKSDLIVRSRNDPVFFIEQVLGSQLWSKQKEICYAVRDHERVAVPACVDDKTRILTETRGFQYFYNLQPGEKVASLENDKLIFVLPTAYHEYDYEGELIVLKQKH